MKLCIAGKNNIAVDILLYSLHLFPKENICVVLNKTESFKNSWQKSLGFHAKQMGVEILTLREVQKIENLIFISLEFDRIIKPQQFISKKLFNIHFSLLPEYKGMFTSLLPILHGKKYSGVTLHIIDRGIDTGNIIEQRKFNIEDLTCQMLYYKYLHYGTKLVKKNLQRLINTEIESTKQPLLGSTYFSKNSFDFSNTEINVRQTSYQIQQQVNSLNFRPYQLASFKGFKICKTEILEYTTNQEIGDIVVENDIFFEIQSVDSNIKLYKDYYDELIEAIRTKKIEQIHYYSKIVSTNSDINEYNKFGWNPMIIACYTGEVATVKILSKYGANLHSINLNGTTTLMYAKTAYESTKNLTLIKYLLQKGVKVKIKDVFGKTIYEYSDDLQLIKLLKKYD